MFQLSYQRTWTSLSSLIKLWNNLRIINLYLLTGRSTKKAWFTCCDTLVNSHRAISLSLYLTLFPWEKGMKESFSEGLEIRAKKKNLLLMLFIMSFELKLKLRLIRILLKLLMNWFLWFFVASSGNLNFNQLTNQIIYWFKG